MSRKTQPDRSVSPLVSHLGAEDAGTKSPPTW